MVKKKCRKTQMLDYNCELTTKPGCISYCTKLMDHILINQPHEQ